MSLQAAIDHEFPGSECSRRTPFEGEAPRTQGRICIASLGKFIDELAAAGESGLRILGKCSRYDRAIRRVQNRKIRSTLQMLRRELSRRPAIEWRHASEHHLVNNGEAILVAASFRMAIKQFWWSV